MSLTTHEWRFWGGWVESVLGRRQRRVRRLVKCSWTNPRTCATCVWVGFGDRANSFHETHRSAVMRSKLLRSAAVACLLLLASVAQADGPRQCPPWRPCGPGNSFGGNRWLAQGGFGADFRPSCARHDACLASGASRAQCDRVFYRSMNQACDSSRHPLLCRMRAFKYYAGARLFGGIYY